jgi:hypothetical protein
MRTHDARNRHVTQPHAPTLGRWADALLRGLGTYKVLCVLVIASTATFSHFLPLQEAKVTLRGTRGGDLILDEHIPTWSADDAARLLDGLGEAGRQAYRKFYLGFDFYFPALLSSLALVSLLALLLKRRPGARYWAFLPVVPYLFDVAENLTHLTMAGAWPDRPAWCWTLGPWFTAGKWFSLFGVLGVVAIAAVSAVRAYLGRTDPT